MEADRRLGASKAEKYGRGPWQEGLRNSTLYVTLVALQYKCILAIMHVVVFCPKHAAGRAEMYHRAGMALYRELLAKLKAAKAVIDWFIQINLLLYLLLARELARVKKGSQEVL